ncbi:MAG: sirohydrochlorin chelatase [Candidatus Polarisedimenticolia bacterium]
MLLIGHGSRVEAANRALTRVAAALRRRLRPVRVVTCYLEAAAPGIAAAVARAAAGGASRILFLPYFLYMGGHVRRDLPRAAARARRRHKGVRVAIAPPLGFDARLVDLACRRALAGMRRAGWP